MIRIAICDDDKSALEYTGELIEKYRERRPELDISIRLFHSGYDLLEALNVSRRFEIFLLDILMPDIDGIKAGEAVRLKNKGAVLIYLTSSPDYALEAFQIKAHAYIVKPVKKTELFAVLDETVDLLKKEDARRLLIRVKDGTEALPFSQLVYLEYYKHHLYCHLTDGTLVESLTLRSSFDKTAAPLLSDERFIKVSVSHIINMQHVRTLKKKSFLLTDGSEIFVTRSCAGARQAYLEYVLKRKGEPL